jgi:sec-independent protein translocase protein TatC
MLPEHEDATPEPMTDDAPPMTGGACDDDIELVAPAVPWRHDGEGYPPEAGLDEVDPDRLPEAEGMAEDDVLLPVPVPAAPLAPVPSAPPDGGEAHGKKKAASLIPGLDAAGVHLEELRKRLIVSLTIFVPLFGVGLWLYKDLWNIVIAPLSRVQPELANFQALTPSDGLIMAMRIAFAFALFISLPVWLSQIWSFVSPGLTSREKRYLYLSLGSGLILFSIGVAAAYFLGIPFALEYLLPFNKSLAGWENSFTGSGYVDFVITCCGGFGMAFELPLVMMALAWTGILTAETLREWWRPIILIIFIIAAVMTPPDPFTQLLLAIPMLLLFVVGYWLVKWVQPKED